MVKNIALKQDVSRFSRNLQNVEVTLTLKNMS